MKVASLGTAAVSNVGFINEEIAAAEAECLEGSQRECVSSWSSTELNV